MLAIKNLFTVIAVAGLIAFAAPRLVQAQAAADQAKQKNWKDRGEYDLYDSITKTADPAKKLALLSDWKTKYPTSEFSADRDTMLLTTYAQSNQPQKTIDTAKDILKTDPANFQALYWIAFLTPRVPVTPDSLDAGAAAASAFLAALPAQLGPDKKPATVKAEDWDKARKETEALGHTTLGWIAMQRKDYEKAEREFQSSLDLNPAGGEVSYWKGTVVLAQKKPEKQSAALYDFARAAAYDGPGALTPAGRKDVRTYLEKAYSSFHGSTEGLDALLLLAKGGATPAANFKVTSTVDQEKEALQKEEDLKKSNPGLALWKNLKDQLTAAGGQNYFDTGMKDAELPGPDVRKFNAKIVSIEPEVKPKKLVVSIGDGTTPDATLELSAALPGKADPGTAVSFNGTAKAFTATPFMVTFAVEKKDLEGWPVKEAAPVKKKRPVHRPVRRKK